LPEASAAAYKAKVEFYAIECYIVSECAAKHQYEQFQHEEPGQLIMSKMEDFCDLAWTGYFSQTVCIILEPSN